MFNSDEPTHLADMEHKSAPNKQHPPAAINGDNHNWKDNLNLPEKDHRFKTSVSLRILILLRDVRFCLMIKLLIVMSVSCMISQTKVYS